MWLYSWPNFPQKIFPQSLPVTWEKCTATFLFYRKITQLGVLYRQLLFLPLQLENNSLLKTEDLEDLPLPNICTHWKSKEFQLIDCKKIISCVLPMVVITVPAKKKELPKSQWLIWADVFPKGMIPAFIAATTCCKFKKILSIFMKQLYSYTFHNTLIKSLIWSEH